MEIAEEGEEEEEEPREAKRHSTIEEGDQHTEITATQSRPRSPITGPPVTLDSTLAISPEASPFASTAETPSFAGIPRPASPATSVDTETGRRLSSQSSRQDYYSQSSYAYGRPRVKLGPRPSAEAAGKQGSSIRPVASMPSSLKLSFKGGKKGHVKTSDDSSSLTSVEPADTRSLASTAPIPEDSVLQQPLRLSYTNGRRPSTSSGLSVKSLPATSAPGKQNAMTPEKLRLMKAMQLREKRRLASEQANSVPSVETTANKEESKEAAGGTEPAMTPPVGNEIEKNADHSLTQAQADSGIEATSTNTTDHGSVHTQTDSRPPSLTCASSEVGDSTKASSLSESTDETVHARDEKDERGNGAGEADLQRHEDGPANSNPPSGSTDNAENKESQSRATEGREEATLTEQSGAREARGALGDQGQETKPVQGDLHTERSFISASKSAAEPQEDGQAGVAMESDPHHVTSVPGRIDEVGPAPVDPAERTQDGSAASPPKWNLPISKYSPHDSSTSPAPSLTPAIVTSSADELDGGDQLADAADTMDAESASLSDQRRAKRPEPIITDLDALQKLQPPQEQQQPPQEQQQQQQQDEKVNDEPPL